MRELGFNDPIKIINQHPQIFAYANSKIAIKINDLKKIGFSDPVKMITNKPSILGLTVGIIQEKLDNLKEIGFENPAQLIALKPSILGYSVITIRERMKYLENVGFVSPVKMAILHPSILCISDNNLQTKLRFYKRVFIRKIEHLGFIERFPSSVSLSQARISLVIRIIRDKNILFTSSNVFHCLVSPKKFIKFGDLEKYPKLNRAYQAYYMDN